MEKRLFSVFENSQADARESTLSALHAFASSGKRFKKA